MDSDIGDDNYDDDDDDDDDVGSMTEKTPVLSSEKRSKVEIWIWAVLQKGETGLEEEELWTRSQLESDPILNRPFSGLDRLLPGHSSSKQKCIFQCGGSQEVGASEKIRRHFDWFFCEYPLIGYLNRK